MDFVNSTAAIEYCAQHAVSDVQLVLKFEDQRYDIVLQVLAEIERTQQTARAFQSV